MNWKPLLKTLVATILALAYTVLHYYYPDFPLTQEKFVEVLLWIIAFAVGGWDANNVRMYLKRKK